MSDSIPTLQVTLQENGIIRDDKGNYLGRLVEDIDSLSDKHYQRGRKHEREACAKVCEEEAASWAKLNAQDEEGYGAIQCAAAIRARGEK